MGVLCSTPNDGGFVRLMIGGCYVTAHLEDLQTLEEPFVEYPAKELENGDTPETGGYKIRLDY